MSSGCITADNISCPGLSYDLFRFHLHLVVCFGIDSSLFTAEVWDNQEEGNNAVQCFVRSLLLNSGKYKLSEVVSLRWFGFVTLLYCGFRMGYVFDTEACNSLMFNTRGYSILMVLWQYRGHGRLIPFPPNPIQ